MTISQTGKLRYRESHRIFLFLCALLWQSRMLKAVEPLNSYIYESESSSKARVLINRLWDADDFTKIMDAIEEMRLQSKEIHRHMIVCLMQHLGSQEELRKFKIDVDSEFAFQFTGSPPILIRKGQVLALPHCIGTCQDITIRGGRCAWALEQLMYLYLTPILKGMKPEQLQKVTAEIQSEILYASIGKEDPVINLAANSVAEKLILAGSEKTHPRILVELAHDDAESVRRKVASNQELPTVTIKLLMKDSDRLVRRYAERNSISTRSIDDTIRDWNYGLKKDEVLKEMKEAQ